MNNQKVGWKMEATTSYQLMYKDHVVIEFNSDPLHDDEIVNQQFVPIGIQNGMGLEAWLRQRRADRSRVSVRKLFATLKMNFGDDQYVSQFRKPTDFWWIRQKGSEEVFDVEVEDLYRLSLNLSPLIPKSPRNFETTNIGSYEKGWKGDVLLKAGNSNELFSELLYAKISAKYMDTAKYFLTEIEGRTFIATPNFVDLKKGEYLILADEWTGTGPEEDVEGWLERFKSHLEDHELETLKEMHFLDVVLNNFDRHCQNFGFVYSEEGSRKIAPNFDFNLSIIGYNGLEHLGVNEMPIATYFKSFDCVPPKFFNLPDASWLKEAVDEISNEMGLPTEAYLPLVDWILVRWEQLIDVARERNLR